MSDAPLRTGGVSLRHAYRVWLREVAVYKHLWKTTIVSTAIDPIIYLTAMGLGLGALVGRINGVPYLEFIAPGLVASAAMLGAAYETAWNTYVRIHHDRVYEAMMATPVNVQDVVAGEMMWATTRSVIQSTIILLVLVAWGLITSWWALLIPVVAALTGLTFAIVGLTYNALIKGMDQLTFFFTLFITPLFLFSGIFFPLDPFPDAVLWVANATPLYHAVIAIRGLAIGNVHPGLALHALWLVGFVVLFHRVPIRLLARRLVV